MIGRAPAKRTPTAALSGGLVTVLLFLACHSGNRDARDDETGSLSDGGPVSDAGDVPVVECALQPDNALRVVCTVTGDAPSPLLFRFGEAEEDRWISLGESEPLTVTGLKADTVYTYTSSRGGAEAKGAFTTGSLPDRLPTIEVSGAPTAELLFFAANNDAVVTDTEGNILWYQEVDEGVNEPQRGTISGYDWTGDGVAVHCGANLMTYGLDGVERLRLERGVDFDKVLHHDLFWSNGRIFSVNAGVHTYGATDFVVDGFYVFDGAGVIAEWDLHDHLSEEPEGTGAPTAMWDGLFPDAEDLAHGNGIFEAADGTILISFRLLDAIYAVSGVDDPAFGEVLWVLGGQGNGDFDISANASVTTDTDFDGQHHPRMEGGLVTLFDNRLGTEARTLTMALDHAAGTAEIVEVHELRRNCGIQSSAYTLPGGNLLATCANRAEVFEYPGRNALPSSASRNDPVWSMTIHTDAPWVARAIPIGTRPDGW